ncbi:hypothetical protein PR048_002518 [Dryococelus australis]|uniref:Uncharacterized protein n=1 Tax=Dryococelus australis TaxID=614101 RepID=A0ABQ9IL54_9NEOP|nr:hypothetical protein PR048_002518 [Dryococelus australis]
MKGTLNGRARTATQYLPSTPAYRSTNICRPLATLFVRRLKLGSQPSVASVSRPSVNQPSVAFCPSIESDSQQSAVRRSVYLEDIIVTVRTFKEHAIFLEFVFQKVATINLKLVSKTCHFGLCQVSKLKCVVSWVYVLITRDLRRSSPRLPNNCIIWAVLSQILDRKETPPEYFSKVLHKPEINKYVTTGSFWL